MKAHTLINKINSISKRSTIFSDFDLSNINAKLENVGPTLSNFRPLLSYSSEASTVVNNFCDWYGAFKIYTNMFTGFSSTTNSWWDCPFKLSSRFQTLIIRSLFCQPVNILPIVWLKLQIKITYLEFYLFLLLTNLYSRIEQIWESYIPLALKQAGKKFSFDN